MNSYGDIYRVTTWGESHGPAIGGVIDGMPAGITVSEDFIRECMDERRPGQSALVTARREYDHVEILSGVFEGVTTGAPIGFIIRNKDARSAAYDNMRDVFRPNHADFTYQAKYGIRDYRGGGRSSARETACRVVGGALAQMALSTQGISVSARLISAGGVSGSPEAMDEAIRTAAAQGDSVGGIVECTIKGCPAGLGDPSGNKLSAMLASAMMSINAAKGFEIGDGFALAAARGSEVPDTWIPAPEDPRGIRTVTNHSGGIQGGISNGEDIILRVAFKPTPTLLRDLDTVDGAGHATVLKAKGRHDPCVAVRAVPVVKAMAAITVLDALLRSRTVRL